MKFIVSLSKIKKFPKHKCEKKQKGTQATLSLKQCIGAADIE